MNYAAEHELPDAQKVSHAHVKYEQPAIGKDRCGNCENFIKPSSCRTVKSPVRADGWCIRFKEEA